MLVTVDGIVTEPKDESERNMRVPTIVRPLVKVIWVMEEQLANVYSPTLKINYSNNIYDATIPIMVTDEGIIIDGKDVSV